MASIRPAFSRRSVRRRTAGVWPTRGSARFSTWSGMASTPRCTRWCEAAAATPTRRACTSGLTGRSRTGVRVRRVHVPGRDRLQARRRRSGHRDGRGRSHCGGGARAAGGVVGAEPGRAACAAPAGLAAIRRRRSAGPRALPRHAACSCGAAREGVGEAEAAGPAGAAGSHRVGGRPVELGQARNLLLLQRLPRLAPASTAGAVCAAQLALRSAELLQRPRRQGDRPRSVRQPAAVAVAGRGRRDRPAARARPQTARAGRTVRPGRAVPGHQRGSRSRLADHRAGAADRRLLRRGSR